MNSMLRMSLCSCAIVCGTFAAFGIPVVPLNGVFLIVLGSLNAGFVLYEWSR